MASQSRILNYFASAKGRKFTFYAAATTAIGAFSVNFFPHTFLVSQYREFVASYREGTERPISESVKRRYENALEYIKVSDFERNLMEPFVVTGFDLYSIGSCKYKHFFYEKSSDDLIIVF